MSADSMFVLVQVEAEHITLMSRVIRTYWSEERATEDMELLRVANPEGQYRIITVPHIER